MMADVYKRQVLFFKISAQIIFRLLRRIHHGIIQPRIRTVQPGQAVPVLGLQRLYAFLPRLVPFFRLRRGGTNGLRQLFKRLLRGPHLSPIRRKPRGTAHRQAQQRHGCFDDRIRVAVFEACAEGRDARLDVYKRQP